MATKSILTETDNRLENIEISKISDELYDFRDKKREAEDKTSEEFEQLKLSIQSEGVLTPIHLAPHKKKSGIYLLVDGRRRFNAIKQLGLKTIPAIIVTGRQAKDLAVITLVQNIHRKDLKGEEYDKAIIKLFEIYEYTFNDVITITNRIDRESTKDKRSKDEATFDALSKSSNMSLKSGRDQEFLDLINRVGTTPRYVRTIVYIRDKIDSEVLREAQKAELPLYYQTLLANKTLKEHKKIAKGLIPQLKEFSNYEDAKAWRDKTVNDLQTGALKKDEDVDRYVPDPQKREDLSEEPETVPTVAKQYLAMLRTSNALLKVFTDDALAKSKPKAKKYSREHIKYTESFRKEIIDNLDEAESTALAENMILTRLAADSILNLVNRKYRTDF